MQIRKLERSDLPRCAELFAAVFSRTPWNEPWSTSRALERLRHFFESSGALGLIAIEQQDICGFALGNTEPFHTRDVFYLREMCVSAELQGGGIGGALLAQLETLLTLQSVAGIYLITERTIPAAAFYVKHGYDHGESTGFYAKSLSA